MSLFDSIIDAGFAAAQVVFGDPVTYRTASGMVDQVAATVDREPVTTEAEGGVEVTDIKTVATIARAELIAAGIEPAIDDEITAPGKGVYQVVDVHPDMRASVKLILRRLRDA